MRGTVRPRAGPRVRPILFRGATVSGAGATALFSPLSRVVCARKKHVGPPNFEADVDRSFALERRTERAAAAAAAAAVKEGKSITRRTVRRWCMPYNFRADCAHVLRRMHVVIILLLGRNVDYVCLLKGRFSRDCQ